MQLPNGGFQRKSSYTVLVMGREMKNVEEDLYVMEFRAPFTPSALLSSIPSTPCSVLFPAARLYTLQAGASRAAHKI